MKKQGQNGSTHVVIIIILVLGLLTALGWIFYQNFIYKESDRKDTERVVVDKKGPIDSNSSSSLKYVDLRKNKEDGTGVQIDTIEDISKLGSIGSDLKKYFEKNVGNEVPETFNTVKGKQYFIVDRIYGNYATGNTNARAVYSVWGPKDGAIEAIADTQNQGFSCKDLSSAKVPAELVDSKCIADDAGLVDYKE